MIGGLQVGLDLDGVCYPFVETLRRFLAERQGRAVAMPPATRWEFFLDWGMSRQEFKDTCDEAVDAGFLFRVGDPYPGVVESVAALRARGHQVHVVTARHFGATGASERATASWLNRVGLEFDSLTFSGDKTVVPTDVFLDDHAENYLALRKAGVAAYLLSRPWNAHVDTPHRATSVAEFVDRILSGPPEGPR